MDLIGWCLRSVRLVGDKRLTENSYFEIKFFEIDLVTKNFFFDFEFSVSLKNPNKGAVAESAKVLRLLRPDGAIFAVKIEMSAEQH